LGKLVIIDTDMVSAFAKIERLDLLKKLFSKHKVVITPRIHEELLVSLQFGYSFPQDIFKHFEVFYPSEKESKDYHGLLGMKLPLGKGELEAISICTSRQGIFSSMDQTALKFAREMVVETLGLHSVLRALWKSQILSRKEVEQIISDI